MTSKVQVISKIILDHRLQSHLLGKLAKLGSLASFNTTIEMHKALEATGGIEFPSSDAKWPSCKRAFASAS